ncbi:hypothetical protein KXD40_009016 [Peronospora effusa]|uniref:Uncharacterized protein n=1 Tax=Peronospora effusa TaxID=542832 RepID=A0A3M6VQ21_9STRA|nr:hypothetical protein DD238_007461 [Peronospora effusa]RQM14455.1 hypothetical protein DD237_005679 [Peronospora effusa]UIZ25339.1 hypothetical protein KXD40_009016 [Peronospora effusa]
MGKSNGASGHFCRIPETTSCNSENSPLTTNWTVVNFPDDLIPEKIRAHECQEQKFPRDRVVPFPKVKQKDGPTAQSF